MYAVQRFRSIRVELSLALKRQSVITAAKGTASLRVIVIKKL